MYIMKEVSKNKHTVRSLKETQQLAQQLVSSLVPKKDCATALLFSGDLGAGKTTFTKSVARALGVKGSVISPTFILEKRYTIKNNPSFKSLVHIDAYRFEVEEEAKVLNLEESAKDPHSLIIIEWPERLGKYKPKNAHTVFFKGIDENTKEISW